MESILETLTNLPPLLIYVVIGIGAAIENIIPPVPADTFVLLGAFIAAAGKADPWLVFAATWFCNVGSACGVYAATYRYGRKFFDTRAGQFLLHPKQLDQIGRFYDRWGILAILVSRFLPAFRAVVPVFAGVTRVPLWRVLPPMAIASAVWYGALVYFGAFAGSNIESIMTLFNRVSGWLAIVAGALIALFLLWWWRSRRQT
jgi:membrane protein DedA with SNARE-associated domain